MSRIILLSEVDGVATKFQGFVAELRSVLQGAGLHEPRPENLPTLAALLAEDAGFREELQTVLAAIHAVEPEMTHLEVLGLLIVAAVGAEQAAGLTKQADLAALRALFAFVRDTRRATHTPDVPSREPAPWVMSEDKQKPLWMTAPAPEEASTATSPATDDSEVPASSGGNRMLGRALAIAADGDFETGQARIAWRPEAAPHAVHFHEEEPTFNPYESFDEPVDEEPVYEAPPRRWGLWTAVTCGVLLGFGLSIFARLDHKTPAPATHSVSRLAPTPAGNSNQRRPKSIAELEAEIAALDATANITPAATDQPAISPRPGPIGRTDPQSSRRQHAVGRSHYSLPALDSIDDTSSPPASGMNTRTTRIAGSAAPSRLHPGEMTAAIFAAAPPARSESTLPPTATTSQPPTPLSPRVMTGSAGIMAANLVSSPAPTYPVAASTAGVQGEVVVEAVVGRNGDVVDTRIVSGPPQLRAAALEAVQRWRYRPYEVDGKPIEVATTARLDFRLDR